jgi:hypothetical protein
MWELRRLTHPYGPPRPVKGTPFLYVSREQNRKEKVMDQMVASKIDLSSQKPLGLYIWNTNG